MFHYIYILFSKKDNKLYTGFTNDLNRRYKEHTKGLVRSTKERRPLELIYFEGYKNEKDARRRENYLKTGWGRSYINKILTEYLKSKI